MYRTALGSSWYSQSLWFWIQDVQFNDLLQNVYMLLCCPGIASGFFRHLKTIDHKLCILHKWKEKIEVMHLVGIMVIQVGEEYEYEQVVQLQDGSLSLMSYWYGKVVDIYLKAGYMAQNTVVLSQGYLEDEGVDLTASVGEYGLILSDLITGVGMCCVEDHATILPYDEDTNRDTV
ncbi:uncharacterized protein BJ212DRAFT_1297301 [Suillus subaureus]|uniref:Uncharacterized protein n=1 Tax=Suillus subaureus TaxID=48587 RepID=A0A9P7EIL0_9AGAM|nr:uncharacterized protein BJ212DRAFT_1297301 [Suillus subaureus]KAG1822058.1 hypothetical protein BJ212DRAFT_1297301 [Suillus subaureus]